MIVARNFIRELIKEKRHFYYEGNVFQGNKIFVVYSVVKWVVAEAKSGKFDSAQVKNYLNAVSAYLSGEIELFWENGVLYVKKLKEKNIKKGK